ncbi:MAG: hypothetical protein ACRBC3_08480 [Burkholderiaceae bacterium]
MITKLTSFAAIAATAATVSIGASAGELYGAIERDLYRPSAVVAAQPVNTGISVDGTLYTEVNTALNTTPVATNTRQPYVTSLAVGGELGYPVDSARLPAGALKPASQFAE